MRSTGNNLLKIRARLTALMPPLRLRLSEWIEKISACPKARKHCPARRGSGPISAPFPTLDVIWFSPGEKHWHGASPTTAMTHIAIQERLDGKVVDWLERVSDEQYRG
jgi:hypothetical protein